MESGFKNFNHGAADVVLAVAFSSCGTRLAVASADHKIRVYDLEHDQTWVQVDQWRGHEAEVLGASILVNYSSLAKFVDKIQWIGSTLGHVFGTIGNDNKFKLWREDQSQAPMGGRRFKCIFSQSPNNHVAYVSFDIKTVKHEVWLVLLAQDGCLSLLEPSESESLNVWKEIDNIFPFGQHFRGIGTTFNVCLHQCERPCYKAILAGLDPKALSLAVSAMNLIKIFRSITSEEGNYQLFEMAELVIDSTMINHVSWAPGCIRPYDLVAAACDDGSARIFEVITPFTAKDSHLTVMESQISTFTTIREPAMNARNAPSGIGAGLAGMSLAAARNGTGSSKIRHEWKQVAVLTHDDNSPMWKVKWMHDGMLP